MEEGTSIIEPGLLWQGSTLVLYLKDPNGTLIGPADTITHPNIKFFHGPTYCYYRITNPAPGKWQLAVHGADLPATPEPFFGYMTAYTDVTMQLSFDNTRYTTGSAVTVRVRLMRAGDAPTEIDVTGGSPITDAKVMVDVTMQTQDLVERLPMTHVGDGIYEATFTNTTAAGEYDFSVHAAVGRVTRGAVEDTVWREAHQSVLVVSPFESRAVLFGTNAVTIGQSVVIASGNVVVNNVREPSGGAPPYELVLGKSVQTASGYNLKGNRILIGAGSVIPGDVFYHTTLTNNGTIGGTTSGTLKLPVVTTLPPFKATPAGSSHVVANVNKTTTVPPGRYRDVVVNKGGTVIFSGGAYAFRSLSAKAGSRIIFNGPTELKIEQKFSTDEGVVVGPNAPALLAKSIIIYVAGQDGPPKGAGEAVTIGAKNTIKANFYAPNGTLWLGKGVVATGAFVARDLIIGDNTVLNLNSAFGMLKPDGDGDSPQGPSGSEQIPESFGLSQNYPNPFNPQTTIAYQLPTASRVTVEVFNILGQLVKTLVDAEQQAGTYSVVWDGRDGNGLKVNSGIYFCRFRAAEYSKIQKMLLVK